MAEYRQWRETQRTRLRDVIPLDTPYNLIIEVSSLCNAKCIYCAHSRDDHDVYEGNMPISLFRKIINEAKDFPHKIKLIEMFGFGEPLCNPNLAEMIRIARESNVAERINFTTNGLLFTRKRIDEIIEAGVDVIRISLQGLNAYDYKEICGVNIDFDEFVKNLEYLYQNRGRCNIRMKIADIVLKNENGKEAFKRIFGGIADSIFVENILPMYESIDYESIDGNILKRAINGRENVRQLSINKVCHRPFYRLRVAANGEVTASCCDTPNDIRYGNIMNSCLIDLWNGTKRNRFLKMQLMGKRFLHPVCKKCILPNDITSKDDILDPYAETILKRFKI